MLNINPLSIAELMRSTARELLLPARGNPRLKTGLHADGSVVSEIDIACEQRLKNGLRYLTPAITMTGEEEIEKNPRRLQCLSETDGCWIADPIDGTGAFLRGERTYGMMLALVHRSETVLGLIYTPETDTMIIAEKGSGCFVDSRRVTLNDRPTTTEEARIAFACRNQDAFFEPILAAEIPHYRKRRNASNDYTRILSGDLDAVFYSEGYMPNKLGKCPPWDHSAGVLAVTEAGGRAAMPYSPRGLCYDPTTCHDRLLVAANIDLFEETRLYVKNRVPELCRARQWDYRP